MESMPQNVNRIKREDIQQLRKLFSTVTGLSDLLEEYFSYAKSQTFNFKVIPSFNNMSEKKRDTLFMDMYLQTTWETYRALKWCNTIFNYEYAIVSQSRKPKVANTIHLTKINAGQPGKTQVFNTYIEALTWVIEEFKLAVEREIQ